MRGIKPGIRIYDRNIVITSIKPMRSLSERNHVERERVKLRLDQPSIGIRHRNNAFKGIEPVTTY